MVPAGRATGLQIQVFNAGTSHEIDAAFATLRRDRPEALFVGIGPFFTSRRVQSVLAAHYSIPAIILVRAITRSRRTNELRNYGAGHFRQMGAYAGRILKGVKPADLPVQQASKIEFVINA